MSRNTRIMIGIVVCALMLITGIVLAVFDMFRIQPGEASGYAEGGAVIRETVDSLDIDWTSGKVTVIRSAGDAFEISETSDKPIPDNQKMQWQLDGKTLKIRHSRPGIRITGDVEKELTVKVPESARFEEVSIDATSGEILLPALPADKLDLKVTSGLIQAEADAKDIRAGATSGDIRLTLVSAADEVKMAATSGSVSLEGGKADRVKASITSGGIGIRMDEVRRLDAGSTSGNILVDAGKTEEAEIQGASGNIQAVFRAFEELDVGTTSGSVSLKLPVQPGFTADMDNSGALEYSLPFARQGDKYVCGDGSGKVEVHCTSGDIRIDAVEE